MIRQFRRGTIIFAGVTAAVVAVGAGAYAVHDANTIHGCYDKKSGVLRVADTCRSNETAIEWNQEGPQGPAGASGGAASYLGTSSDVPVSKDPVFTTVVYADLPAGTYLLTGDGKIYFNYSGGSDHLARCGLKAGDVDLGWSYFRAYSSPTSPVVVHLTAKAVLTDPGNVSVYCTHSHFYDTEVNARDFSLLAHGVTVQNNDE